MDTSIGLLVKLGSIAVHAGEYLSPHGHPLDLIALKQLLADREVCDWVKTMGPMLPVKRRP
jgi:hypothetical protein